MAIAGRLIFRKTLVANVWLMMIGKMGKRLRGSEESDTIVKKSLTPSESSNEKKPKSLQRALPGFELGHSVSTPSL